MLSIERRKIHKYPILEKEGKQTANGVGLQPLERANVRVQTKSFRTLILVVLPMKKKLGQIW